MKPGAERVRESDLVIADAAQADLEQIDEYIAADNPTAADRLLDDLYGAMQRAAEEPAAASSVRDDLTDHDVRFILVRKRYWVIYTVASSCSAQLQRRVVGPEVSGPSDQRAATG